MKSGLRRIATNFFIVSFVALIFVDTFPTKIGRHQQLLDAIDPIYDVTGLWQGPWELFAPGVDRENHRILVEVDFEDGSTRIWNSPDWSEMSCWQKFRNVRKIEFYDRIRSESNRAAWSSFARFAAREVKNGESEPVRARLVVLSKNVPPPGESDPDEWTRTQFHTESLLP